MGGGVLNSTELDSLELARHIVDVIADQKGEDILLLDIQDVSILADYFVIGGVIAERQAKAVVEDVKQGVKETYGIRPLSIEGEAADGWVLMDFGSVIVHLFTPEMRTYYDLEGLWRAGRVVVRVI
jgi:ribosome-associated protein